MGKTRKTVQLKKINELSKNLDIEDSCTWASKVKLCVKFESL